MEQPIFITELHYQTTESGKTFYQLTSFTTQTKPPHLNRFRIAPDSLLINKKQFLHPCCHRKKMPPKWQNIKANFKKITN